jgi:nitrous oxidase accessory protein NosD
MENSDCVGAPFSVGIKVVGEPLYQTSAEVIKNVISGADVGVEVDGNVLDAHFSGNTLIGDSADIGICSEASNTSTKGKPNVWSGYDADDEIVYGPCY